MRPTCRLAGLRASHRPRAPTPAPPQPGPPLLSTTGDENETTDGAMVTTDAGDSTTTGTDAGEDAQQQQRRRSPAAGRDFGGRHAGKDCTRGPGAIQHDDDFYATSARAALTASTLAPCRTTAAASSRSAVAIYGAVDNGDHGVEVIAESDHYPVPFKVNAPATGMVAWAVPGPAGSRTRRIALTASCCTCVPGALAIAASSGR